MPVQIVTFAAFKRDHTGAEVVSNDTGHERDYGYSPYESYFSNDGLMVPVKGVGDEMARKTLGIGVVVNDRAWFVPAEVCKDGYALKTPEGDVRIVNDDTGLRVESAPEGARTAQTFYYSWSAFYPETEVIRD